MKTSILLLIFVGIGFRGLPANASDSDFWSPGTHFVGFQAGWGEGFSLGFSGDGDGRLVEYIAVMPQFGFDISGKVGSGRWYQGNLDVILEAEYFNERAPKSGYSAGGALLLRYNARHWRRLSPYLEIGFGMGHLDFDLRDQADGFVFYPQAGAGVNLALNRHLALNLGWRYHHMSNAGTRQPNNGINANLFLAGFSYSWH